MWPSRRARGEPEGCFLIGIIQRHASDVYLMPKTWIRSNYFQGKVFCLYMTGADLVFATNAVV